MNAATINANTLTNYLSKGDLELCSESGGQGRARKFCLIDVYQIVLLAAFTRLSGRVEWSAAALNQFLFEHAEMVAVARDMKRRGVRGLDAGLRSLASLDLGKEYDSFKDGVCESIKQSPEVYWHRDLQNPLFLYASEIDLAANRPVLHWGRSNDLRSGQLYGIGDGIVAVNLTKKLHDADAKLIEAQRDREDGSR